jgi:hypothetical protein
MNAKVLDWQVICFLYFLSAFVAAPLFMPSPDFALPFYGAQLFIVSFTIILTLVSIGMERLLE